ncbi:hypothetical protein REPUB_Repub08aG0042400 [Reevesia pubescens]
MILYKHKIIVFGGFCDTFREVRRTSLYYSDVKEVAGKYFDYNVVGGGTVGYPLAATLSEEFSVLLIEGGGSPYDNPLVLDKRFYGFSFIQTDEFSSVSQDFKSTDGAKN